MVKILKLNSSDSKIFVFYQNRQRKNLYDLKKNEDSKRQLVLAPTLKEK